MLVKKLILALFLSVGICAVGAQTDVYASEPTVQEDGATGNDGEVQKDFVDLSDGIIQEGGFPKAESTSRKSRSTVDSGKEIEVQKALIAAWDSFAESCDLSVYKLSPEEVQRIYQETINTHPRYFYLPKSSYAYNPTTGIVSTVNMNYDTTFDKNKVMQQLEAYDRAIADIMRGADSSWSDMEKALYVNDYLARNYQYVSGASNAHSSYGALVDKEAVCQGYALAFLELTRQLGVTCEMVTSASVNHAWNMIKVGDNYYHVDVTWNDPLKDMLGRAKHIFFMKSTHFFKTYKTSENADTHFKQDDWVLTGSVLATAASNTSYDSYLWDSVDVGFDYVDGSWYGFNGTDAICQYICDGEKFTEGEIVVEIKDKWDVIGRPNYSWQNKYVGTGAFGGKYYYSGSTAVYNFNIDTKESKTVFQLEEAQKETGRIYGINITPSGDLQYVLSESPNESGTIHTVERLTGDTKPNLYTIHFDGNGASSGSMEDMKFLKSGEEYTLKDNQFVNGENQFRGWNTKQDGSGTSYADGAKINYQASSDSEKLTLYAQWGECPHAKTEIRNKKDADCKSEGYTGDTYCLNCEKEIAKGRPIEKGPHTVVIDERVEATCTEEGKTEGSHCSVCGEVFTKQQVIPATDHEWDTEYTVDEPATEEKDGQKSIHCGKCDEIKDVQVIPQVEAGHVHEPVEIEEREATCTRDGRTAGVSCERCWLVLEGQERIPAKGHTEVTDEAVKATCTKSGFTEGSHCSACGLTLSGRVELPPTGHSFGAWVTKKNPQIGVPGRQERVCSSCGETQEQEIAALKDTVVKVSSISITTPLSGKIAAGKKVTLKAAVSPSNATNKGVTWRSSNTKVAKVDQNGKVTVLKKSGGKKAVITAVAKDGSGAKGSVTIKSMKGVVKSVSISGKKKVKAGKSIKLKAKVKATKGANKAVIWSSSNPKVAAVSKSGKVSAKPKMKGKKVKITALAADGSGKKKSITIKIQ